jgi:Putative  PD-(D/E)XK family member, (DUF4420)
MALQSDAEELQSAWRALADDARSSGWRTIPVLTGGPCPLMAGRRYPGNEEAIVVRFAAGTVPQSVQLPQGGGFNVTKLDSSSQNTGEVWIALSRQTGGNADLFLMMVVDVVGTLRALGNRDDIVVFHTILSRIAAWQAFMRGGRDRVLSAEAEVGLYGELEVLQALIDAGLTPRNALDRWKGPLDGLHDFVCEPGALEVKASVAAGVFRVNIGSLDQLDNSLIQPLFLTAVRLTMISGGTTLPEKIRRLRDRFSIDTDAVTIFGDLLLQAGFIDAVCDRYTRKFGLVGIQTFLVTEEFPRLTRNGISSAIRAARYEMDLDLATLPATDFADALSQLGLKQKWN